MGTTTMMTMMKTMTMMTTTMMTTTAMMMTTTKTMMTMMMKAMTMMTTMTMMMAMMTMMMMTTTMTNKFSARITDERNLEKIHTSFLQLVLFNRLRLNLIVFEMGVVSHSVTLNYFLFTFSQFSRLLHLLVYAQCIYLLKTTSKLCKSLHRLVKY